MKEALCIAVSVAIIVAAAVVFLVWEGLLLLFLTEDERE